MNRFNTVFEKLERPVLLDLETVCVTLVSTDDGAYAEIDEVRQFAASLADDHEPAVVTAGHADTADIEMRGCSCGSINASVVPTGAPRVERVCETCDFWQATENPLNEQGKCRAHPPAPHFPITVSGDWCGEWRGV